METSSSLRLHPSGLFLHLPGFPPAQGWACGFTTLQARGSLDPVLPVLGWANLPVFRLAQVHGHRILTIDPSRELSGIRREGDGLATACRGIVMAVASADCVPVILFDPQGEAGAVLHAGWRGTLGAIVREGVRTMREQWGSLSQDLVALLGPCIGPCCYEVGREVVEAFRASGFEIDGVAVRDGATFRLDLPAANRWLLREAGVRPERIFHSGLCTFCRADLFPSFRREGPRAGRILGFMGSAPLP